MNTHHVIASDSFVIDDTEDVIGLAKSLVDGTHPGVLSTVDREGKPQMRWMATLSFDEFPVFYTLSAPGSGKVDEINHQPAVNWMFSNNDLSLILNLIGTARVLTDTPTLKRVWQQIEDKSQAYFLDQYAKGPAFVVIETKVDAIECVSPRNCLRFALTPAELVD